MTGPTVGLGRAAGLVRMDNCDHLFSLESPLFG